MALISEAIVTLFDILSKSCNGFMSGKVVKLILSFLIYDISFTHIMYFGFEDGKKKRNFSESQLLLIIYAL